MDGNTKQNHGTMLDRLPTEVQLVIWSNLKRIDVDRAGCLSKKFVEFVNANTDRLPSRQIKLHFDDPLVGFRAWELGVCRHTLQCRYYQLARVLRGCLVRAVTVSNSTPISNEYRVGFDWLVAMLQRYSHHFKVCDLWWVPSGVGNEYQCLFRALHHTSIPRIPTVMCGNASLRRRSPTAPISHANSAAEHGDPASKRFCDMFRSKSVGRWTFETSPMSVPTHSSPGLPSTQSTLDHSQSTHSMAQLRRSSTS